MPTRWNPSMSTGVMSVVTIFPSLPPRRTLNGIGVPFGALLDGVAPRRSADLIGVPPTLSRRSRTWSLPSAGVPSVTARDLDGRLDVEAELAQRYRRGDVLRGDHVDLALLAVLLRRHVLLVDGVEGIDAVRPG